MTPSSKHILIISILASIVVFLDSSVVNVALPAIDRNLGGGLATQEWVVDAYLITLGSLILIAGSLSDIFGRKRILTAGLIGFGITSLLCSLSPTSTILIIARGLQGTMGALLVPSSLAIIISNFKGQAQGKAIGTWTAWTGVSFVIGPLLGGFLIDNFSWRLVFAINVIPIAICLILISKTSINENKSKMKLDIVGAVLCCIGLLTIVYSLIEQPVYGWSSISIYLPFIVGLASLLTFLIYESKISNPMLPLSLFRTRNFSAGNISTIAIYSGLSIATFLIVIFLQQVSKYSALFSGLALLPVTIIMFVMSPRFGKLAGKYGPRALMTVGPIVAGVGFLLMLLIDRNHVTYFSQLFPGILVFGLGLSMTVSPLTFAVLGSIDKKHSGIASAVNNAISRIAGLIAIAIIGIIVGSKISLVGFRKAIVVTAILLIFGGVISFVGIKNQNNITVE